MSDRLTQTAFASKVGETFSLGGGATLLLRAVRPLGGALGASTREPFALDFETTTAVPLTQGSYELGFPDGGVETIFLVPVGRTPDGRLVLEAIFT